MENVIIEAVRIVYAVRGSVVTRGERIGEGDLTARDGRHRPRYAESVRAIPNVVRDQRDVKDTRGLIVVDRCRVIAEAPVTEVPDITGGIGAEVIREQGLCCLLYTSPSPRDRTRSRMPSSA